MESAFLIPPSSEWRLQGRKVRWVKTTTFKSNSANLNLQQADLFAVGYLEISLVYKSSSWTVNSVAECDVADWVIIKAGLWLALWGSSVCPESCRRGSGKTSDEHGQSPGLAGSWLSSITCSSSPYQFCCLWPQSLWARDHHVSACSVWHYVRSKVPDLLSYSEALCVCWLMFQAIAKRYRSSVVLMILFHSLNSKSAELGPQLSWPSAKQVISRKLK